MRGKQSREKVATLRRMNVTGNPRRNGFSFAELIAAIALITLMFGLVAQINIAISSTVLRNELHLAASEEAPLWDKIYTLAPLTLRLWKASA